MPTAFLCDFDGTVSPSDIGASLVRRFSSDRDEERSALLDRWLSGRLGHRQLTVEECRLMTVSSEQALAFTRGFAIDEAFPAFVREAEARGDAIMVVSEGLDFYVRDHLERAGLGHLPSRANRACFVDGGIVPEFPHSDDTCGECGNCKAQHVRAWRERGYHVVFIGDGYSDRCGARAADAVLARGSLLEWCRAGGVDVQPFENFHDVTRLARAMWSCRDAS
jgi:2,3-diketo-5-methylthio-1-phosphopentane phosphatase